MTIVMNDVEALIKKEVLSVNERFPLFHSPYEGYGALLKEVDDASEDMDIINSRLTVGIWMRITRGDYAEDAVEALKYKAETLAIEAIRLAALCDKYIESRKTWPNTVE